MMEIMIREIDTVGRHLEILELVIENEPIGSPIISGQTEYPEHHVRYSLRILEENDLIKPTTQGVVTTDLVNDFVEDINNRLSILCSEAQAMKIHSRSYTTE